jgi:hypothetical protein
MLALAVLVYAGNQTKPNNKLRLQNQILLAVTTENKYLEAFKDDSKCSFSVTMSVSRSMYAVWPVTFVVMIM